MRVITDGKDKGWCRCEKCGCLLVPNRDRYEAHVQECDGTDASEFRVKTAPFGTVPLSSYVKFVADVPLPTRRQKENFADYVAHAHSWYKHLSPYPPGAEFRFFIDKYAGCERASGTPLVRDRIKHGFHYSTVPTRLYRSSFGYLAYTTDRINKVGLIVPFAGTEAEVRRMDPMAQLFGTRALMHGLPEEIFDAGVARLTGAMHTLCAANIWVWDEDRPVTDGDWPHVSGGLATLEKVFERCREIRAHNFERKAMPSKEWLSRRYPSSHHHMPFVDAVLCELLAPEQRRQQAEIISAIDRVCEVIESHRAVATQAED